MLLKPRYTGSITSSRHPQPWPGKCFWLFPTKIKQDQALMSMEKFGQTAPNFGCDFSVSHFFGTPYRCANCGFNIEQKLVIPVDTDYSMCVCLDETSKFGCNTKGRSVKRRWIWPPLSIRSCESHKVCKSSALLSSLALLCCRLCCTCQILL